MSGPGPEEVQEELGKGGGCAAIGLVSAAFHEPELALRAARASVSPNAKPVILQTNSPLSLGAEHH